MDNLTERERDIVRAALHLANVNARLGYVPDYEVNPIMGPYCLDENTLRSIRDEVQRS